MKRRVKEGFEAGKVIVSIVVFVSFVFLDNFGAKGEPFASPLLFAVIHCGGGIVINCALYILSLAFNFSLNRLICALAVCSCLCLIYGLFGRKKQLGTASVIFLTASLSPYVLLGDGNYVYRLIVVIVITVEAFAFLPAIRSFAVKGLRQLDAVEGFSLTLIYVCAFIGGIKYVGVDGYKAFAILSLCCITAISGGKEGCLFAVVLAIPLAISSKRVEVFAPFAIYGAVAYMTADKGKLPLAVGLVSVELVCAYVFRWHEGYSYVQLLYFCVPLVVYAVLPSAIFRKLKDILAMRADMPLPRGEINRTRAFVSGRLYEISATFREISSLFGVLSANENPFAYEDAIIEEISKVCEGCSLFSKCKAVGFPEREDLIRLIAIGKGKGRLTAVDLPKKISQKCAQTNKILFAINKYVGLYSAEIERKKAVDDTRELVALQAEGVSYALKGVAKGLSKQLSFKGEKERKLCRFFLKKGVNVQQVMLLGEGSEIEAHVLLLSNLDELRLVPIVNEFFKAKFCVAEKMDVEGGRIVCVLRRACKYDCIFGVSTVMKQGEVSSGDAHSLIRLERNKFMLALSDGMGSGQTAKATSSASLSLIESLFRCGLPPEICLTTINRLLSFSGEENFSALDLGVIDLDGLTCEFIKLGAPYGFIISSGSVKVVEGSSLPLGILQELKPSVCIENLSSGDVVVFLSDGVTDAFGSSTDFADFLATVGANNPQKLSDSILKEALSKTQGVAKDDMTVVSCKIFSA